MKNIDVVAQELSSLNTRHDKFKNIFIAFQESMEHLTVNTFPVKGIEYENISDEITRITFVSRKYEVQFTSCITDSAFKGKISFSRILSDTSKKEIDSIIYNGQSSVDITPPAGEDPLSLNEDSCCLNIILNWLSKEINA